MKCDCFISAGTEIRDGDLVFKTLTDTKPHGCPMVEILEPGYTGYKKGDTCARTLPR